MTLSPDKLLAWLESELRKNEEHIAFENRAQCPDLDTIPEYEGRIWAYKLIRQFVESGCADEAGAVCGACGSTEMLVITGQIVCRLCYEFRCSECSMVPASSKEGKVAIQYRQKREKAGIPESEL